MREYSVPPEAEIPESANLTDTVFIRAAEDPDVVMLRRKTKDGWRDVTARQFRDEVAGVAKGLIAAGVEPGDRVALMSKTRYEWTVADYAIWAAGGVTVPIYETSSAEQVKWIVGNSEAKAIFVETKDHQDKVDQVRQSLPTLTDVWLFDDGALDKLTELGGEIDDATLEQRRRSRTASDLATIVYTSGTTGMPKGCQLSHGNLLFDVRNAMQIALHTVLAGSDAATLLFLPLAHVFGRIIQIGCLEANVVFGHTADIANLVDDLRAFRPTYLLSVPRVFEKIYNRAEQRAAAAGKSKIFQRAAETAIAYSRALDSGGPGIGLRLKHALFDRLVYGKLREATGGRMRYALSGGSALGERLGHFFRGIGIEILEGWGMTETSAAATISTPEHNKIGTVGRPLPGTAIRIADDGEVLVRGEQVFGGYWKNEKATAEALDSDGWLRTGDVGELDDDGFLKITGRKKELIVTAGGKNVAPAPMEDRVRAHPLVSQCMVVGDDRPYVTALITLDAEALEQWKATHGKEASVAELRQDPDVVGEIQKAVDDANALVSRAESIRKFAILETDWSEASGHLTPSLKIKRNVIERDFAKDIELLYS